MDYTHLIFTRFNININNAWSNDSICLDQSWLEHRFLIFKEYCFPSLLHQQCQNFTWIILVHEKTPIQYLAKLKEIINPMINAFIEKDTYGYNRVFKEVAKKYLKNKFVISSRVDNDDMLSTAFVKSISLKFNAQNFQLINFVNGYKYDISNKQLYKINKRYYNAFISLVSQVKDRNNIQLVFDKKHNEWNEINTIDINDYGWCIIIHGGNIHNSSKGYLMTSSDQFNKQFYMNISVLRPKVIMLFKNRTTYFYNLVKRAILNYLTRYINTDN